MNERPYEYMNKGGFKCKIKRCTFGSKSVQSIMFCLHLKTRLICKCFFLHQFMKYSLKAHDFFCVAFKLTIETFRVREEEEDYRNQDISLYVSSFIQYDSNKRKS